MIKKIITCIPVWNQKTNWAWRRDWSIYFNGKKIQNCGEMYCPTYPLSLLVFCLYIPKCFCTRHLCRFPNPFLWQDADRVRVCTCFTPFNSRQLQRLVHIFPLQQEVRRGDSFASCSKWGHSPCFVQLSRSYCRLDWDKEGNSFVSGMGQSHAWLQINLSSARFAL